MGIKHIWKQVNSFGLISQISGLSSFLLFPSAISGLCFDVIYCTVEAVVSIHASEKE